jgi:hypothetical protein
MRIQLAALPTSLTSCNCSLCHRLGTLWAYYPSDQVRFLMEGATVAYVQGDRTLKTHHCQICGCTTHWESLDKAAPRMAINARLLPRNLTAGIRVRHFDGADSWSYLEG